MNPRVQRTHDKLYLTENRYEKPKEMFSVVANLAIASGALQERSSIVDAGCAAGEFLYYLVNTMPNAVYKGFDILPELIEKAKSKVTGVSFFTGSVLDESTLLESSVDTMFLLGVHSIFDDFRTCFANMIRWTRKGGYVYIVGLFNPYPVDVWVKYRLASDGDIDHLEPGWNIFSKASVSRYLDSLGVSQYRFIPFNLSFDLLPHDNDPIRTWTFQTNAGIRLFTNGLLLLVNLEILEIKI